MDASEPWRLLLITEGQSTTKLLVLLEPLRLRAILLERGHEMRSTVFPNTIKVRADPDLRASLVRAAREDRATVAELGAP
jgi:hypothetical protein